MNLPVSERLATRGLLSILALVVVFHGLVLTQVIPFQVVWGGRLKSISQMLTFETVSISLNLLMLAVVSIRAGVLKVNVSQSLITFLLWLMTGLFLLNTVGNLASKNEWERLLFTPLTLVLAVFSGRLAMSKLHKLSA